MKIYSSSWVRVWRENHQIMMIYVEDMVEYGEFIAAVAPTAPVVTVPRLTTIVMAKDTEEKSCIVPAAAAAAVLHGDVGGGRATYNPGRNVKNLGHATGRPDDVCMGATKPPALEDAAEKEEEENLLGNLWTEVQEQCWLAGPTTLVLMVQYLTALIVISFVGLLGAQYLTPISLTNCFAISLVSTFWYVWVMFVSSNFPPTDIERERRQEDLGLLLDNTDQTTIITLYWDFFATRTSNWTRDFVWTSLWSKAVPSGGNLLAGSNFCPVSGCHTHMCA